MKEKAARSRQSRRAYRSRVVKLTAAAVGATLLLAACSAGGTPKTSGGAITYWYGLDAVTSQQEAIWQKYNQAPFEKAYPNIQLNAIPQSGSTLDAKVKTALAAGQAPDFIQTPGSSNAIPYATANYFEDLTADAKKENWKNTILPWALDMGYIKGKLEALPTSYESMVLYYNKTLFKKYGWTPPTDRASLEKLAGEMEAKGITPFAAGNASYTGATEWLVSDFLNEVAGPTKIHDALAGKIPWTDPSIVSAIQLMKDYFDKGYFGGGVKQYFSTQDPQKYTNFADGKAGMYLSGSWEMGSFSDYFGANGNKDQWGWAPLPPLASGVPSDFYPLSVGGTLSVNAASKNVKGSIDYVNWLFSDTKNMWAYAAKTGSEPLPIKYSTADIPKNVDPRYAAQYEAINAASEKSDVGYVSWTSFGPQMEAYNLANEDKVVNNSLSVATFCAGLEQAFKADTKSGLMPTLFNTKS
jgi:raffinose/stachyose/melibiose transport system substrate-binding protein